MNGFDRFITTSILNLLTDFMSEEDIIRTLKNDYDLELDDILGLNYFYAEDVEAVFNEE